MSGASRLAPLRPATAEALPGMVGEHPLMVEVYRRVRLVAPSEAPVIVIGETGTGKELVARALHDLSPRRRGIFLAVNAAALPETLLESELFGHERGAFSDARATKLGLLESAHCGTFYCDELPALSLGCQAKLLRAVEDGAVRRVGGIERHPAAPRWVVSCQAIDPESRTGRGVREDLWHRLSEAIVVLPPLRDRVSDIPLLVAHFLALRGYPADWIETAALDVVACGEWRGNVRELQRLVGRLVLTRDGRRITVGAVRRELESDVDPLRLRARAQLSAVLEACDWSVQQAAKEFGVHRATLYRRLRTCGLEPPRQMSHLSPRRRCDKRDTPRIGLA